MIEIWVNPHLGHSVKHHALLNSSKVWDVTSMCTHTSISIYNDSQNFKWESMWYGACLCVVGVSSVNESIDRLSKG